MSRQTQVDHTKHIYVVREGGTIFWPNGLLRGAAGYVVRGDDPFMTRYFNNGKTPAMLVINDEALPGTTDDWPAQYRKAAGEAYLTSLERKQKNLKAKKEKAEKSEKERTAKEIIAQIPLPDEK